jgi:hypothetical protein
MSQPDEVSVDIRDAFALLTASHDADDSIVRRSVLPKVLGKADGDVEIASKLLNLVAGMTVVTNKLLDYALSITVDKHDHSLTDLAADTNNTTAVRHLREMTEVAKQLVDYCAQKAGVSHEAVLGRLGKDLDTSSGE